MRKLVLVLIAVVLATGSVLPNASAQYEGWECKAFDCFPVEGSSHLYWCCDIAPYPPYPDCQPLPETCTLVSTG